MATQNICNICGAEYEYRDGRWRCPACGAYKPEEISNEEETLLYNAAQKLRLGAFDDAEELYRDITRQYPKNSRGYWGLVLAKYGIIYERDYDGKMVPSCYATKYESISGDDNYKKALQYADSDNKKYYLTQANLIEEVRRKWIEIAEREEPYDVFISYKDSDKENNIERTQDSFDAYELYVFLKDRGYRVFFSRESLRGKEGDKYEPYIFNALNTAQVMIVYGSKPEYIESTWVKNEWMRYYKRIRHGDKQDNSLILAYKGFNPSKLPKPLCDIQGVDLGRAAIGFGDIEAKVSEILINAKKRQKMVRRTVKVRREQTSEKLQKIETKEIGRVAVVPKAERERVAVRAIGAKTLKLSASAENTLNVAQGYLERGDFAEAAERFKSVLVSSPRNGRALTGVLLAGSASVSTDAFVNGGAANLSDMSLLEKVLGCAEKDVAEKILQAVCRDVERSLSAGDVMRAKQIVAVIREYDDVSVDKMRRGLFDAGLKLLPSDEHSARYFIDINLDFEEDNRTYIKKLHTAVSRAISYGKFDTAKYWLDVLKNTDPASFDTQVCLIEAEYKVKSADEVLNRIESEKAYSRAEDIIALLDRPSAEKWLGICLDEASYLIDSERFGGAQRWIEMCAKYNFESREAKLKELLEKCIKRASEKSAECFESLLTYVADGNDTVYVKNALEFAASARSGGNFSCAKIYYGKALAVWPDCIPAARGRFYADIGCADEQQLPEKIGNISDWTCFEDVLAVQKDDADDLFWIKKLAKACIDNVKEYKLSAAKKIFEVFEKLLSYIPEKSESDMLVLLGNMADLCLSEGLFDEAGRFYSMYIGEDSECSAAYWGLLSAKLKCRNEEELVKQPKPLSEFEEFENAQLCAAGNKPLLNHYMDVREKQTAHIKKAKRRSRAIKISAIALSAAVVAGGAVGGFLAYYNSQSGLVYSENNGGYVVSAGKFYNAGEQLVIPEEYNGQPVVAIDENGFAEHTEIEQLVLPESVVRIEEGAFAGCVNLTGVTVSAPDVRAETYYSEGGSLEYIGARAFEGCSSLAEFSFEYGLEYVGERAFADTAFTQVSVPGTVNFVGAQAFYGCESLAEIIVGDREELPAEWAQNWNEGCDASVDFRLRVVLDYNGATSGPSVGEEYVSYGREFELPVPVRSGYSFDGWYSGDACLTDSSGRSISAWQSQSGGILTAKWVANINTLAFDSNGGEGEMDSLSIATDGEATLPQNAFTRAGYTFAGWSTTPNGSAIYADQSQYTMGPSSSYILYAVWRANMYNVELNANGGTTETDNIQVAFGSQYTLPVPSRENCEFGGWYSEADGNGTLIADEQGNGVGVWSGESDIVAYALWYEYTEGLMYELNDDDGYTLTGLSDKSVDEVFIPSYYNGRPVTQIAGTALQNCINMRSLTVPSTVTEIAGGALYGCGSLEELTLPFIGASREAEGEQTLLGYLFGQTEYENSISVSQYCSSESYVDFYLPESLVSVRVTDTTTIGFGAFSFCSNLTNITLPVNLTSIGDYALRGCSFTNITIPEGVTGIGIWAFADCCELESILIPKNVTSMGNDVFSGCRNLIIYCEAASQPSGWDSWWNGSPWTDDGWPVIWDCNNSSTDSDGYMYAVIKGFQYRLKNGEATVIGQSQDISGEVQIPSNVTYMGQSYNVTGVGDYAFYERNGLTGITIPEGVTAIGAYTFGNCSNLQNVAIPSSITSIGDAAFINCSKINAVYIKDMAAWCAIEFGIYGEVTSSNPLMVGEGNLYLNGELVTELDIPEGVTGISDYLFYNCSNIVSVQLPDSVTNIGSQAFYNCSNLTSINLPEGITDIGGLAFYGCSSLTSITLPESLTRVSNYLFYECSGLTSITIPEGVMSIGSYAFCNCSSLTSVTIAEGVTSIGNSAFYNCSSLASVVLPKGVTNIGNNVFRNCLNLQSVVIPEGVTSIGDGAFNNCSNLSNIVLPESLNSIGSQAFEVYNNLSCLTNITIPVGVVNIGYFAFAGRGCLTIYCEAEIKPSGWNNDWKRGSSVVWNCKNNDVDEDGYAYAVINGLKFSFKDNEASVETQPISTCGDIFIPSSVIYNGITYNVTSIAANAFRHCEGIKSIIIPEGVTSIGASAFEDCNNLTIIVIPDSVTSMGGSAFYGCSSLTSIELPSGITNIGSYTFNGCTALTNLIIPSNVTDIGESAFAWCSGLINITIPKGVVVMGRNAFQGYKSIIYCEVESLPEGWNNSWNSSGCPVIWNCNNGSGDSSGWIYTVIGGIHYALRDENATVIGQPVDLSGEIVIPASITYEGQVYRVTSVNNYAFAYCSEITKIVIPDSVTYIADYTFYNCSSLTDISILGSVTQIGEYAFAYCSNLINITIPESVWHIGDDAFVGCSSLTSITIPENVTSIGVLAFANCSSLKSVVFSGNSQLRTIDRMAFQYCTGLTSVVIPESVTSVGDYAFRGCSNITIYCEATS